MLALSILSWALLTLQVYANPSIPRKLRVQEERYQKYLKSGVPHAPNATCTSSSCYRYYNSRTAPYFIKEWPDVPFPTGEFYGGEIPIDESDPSRTLFFIFKPAESMKIDAPTNTSNNDLTIWLNGGPGCSSLGGFLQEVGPIQWRAGTIYPRRNEWAWSKLTNMLWVEQPVGTGFSQGRVTAHNEQGVADDFAGFFKNWQKLFGIKNYDIYVTGESYAGRYIPYISAKMLDLKDTTYYNLKGALMYDPCIGDCGKVQMGYPTYYDVLAHNEIYGFDDQTVAEMGIIAEECGMNAYMDTYLSFPPPGNQPIDYLGPHIYNSTCFKIFELFDKIGAINPCFNVYHITDYCPYQYSPITLFGQHSYFERADVKKAIHAPSKVNWTDCSYRNVFVGYDTSPPPNLDGGPLAQIIEATNRVLISNGDWDALIYSNGTLLAIQNMTWNGALGFQSAPSEDFVVDLPGGYYGQDQGVLGVQHYERGLQWVVTYQAGHQQPQYQPRAAFKHLQWMLGRIESL